MILTAYIVGALIIIGVLAAIAHFVARFCIKYGPKKYTQRINLFFRHRGSETLLALLIIAPLIIVSGFTIFNQVTEYENPKTICSGLLLVPEPKPDEVFRCAWQNGCNGDGYVEFCTAPKFGLYTLSLGLLYYKVALNPFALFFIGPILLIHFSFEVLIHKMRVIRDSHKEPKE
jgi:hypothetical protein